MHRALDRRPLLELNVSSLSDWPVAYRRLSFAWDAQAQRLLVRAPLMPGERAGSDGELLAAWADDACARIGPEPDAFVRFDRGLVEQQKASRGSLFDWLVSAFSPVCTECGTSLYAHAQAYQDAMLDTIVQLAEHLGQRVHGLYDVPLPAVCGAADFIDCSRDLQAQRPADFAGHVALFRHKADLVARLGGHLDTLQAPQAAAYMTCRAVHAAKLDFELTDDGRNAHRAEANRRAEQFFRAEASIGLD